MLPVMADNFGVSDNGEWAIVDSPGRGILRINLVTMEVLPFTNSFELGNGTGASIRSAISSDGRYAVVASKAYNYFKVFDLSTCSSVPNTITAPVTGCQSRDLNIFARSKIIDMGGALHIRFLTNNLIQFYATYNVSTDPVIGKFIIAAPNTYLTGMDYLAMGDSFTSGEGAHKYEIGTDEKDINMCHLSKVSYPYLIAKKIQANSFHSVACSGAKTVNIQGGPGVIKNEDKKDRDNQYTKLPINNSIGEWLPGYKKQIGFISVNNPGIVTLSVGGNDIGFDDKLKVCLKPGTCFPSYEDRQEVFNEVDNKLSTFTATFKKTKEFATKNARIYVIGYPQVAKPDGNCALNVHLNQDELEFAESLINRINAVIHVAAQQAGVNYVDIKDALTGFRLCENKFADVAVNGLTAGNDILGILGNESYHPNEFGHELIANKILGTTNFLGVHNPAPDPAVKLEKIKDTDPALKNAPKTGRVVKKKVSVPAKAKVVKKSNKATVSVKGNKAGLPPNTSYDVTVDGNPAGTATTDDNGDIDVEIDIPADTEPGPVEIDITGPDVAGEEVDIGTVVTVGNDGPDFDGDTIPDTQDSCPTFINSLVDIDQDNIDDACDAFIGPAPAAVSPDTQTTPPSSSTPKASVVTVVSTIRTSSAETEEPITFIETPDATVDDTADSDIVALQEDDETAPDINDEQDGQVLGAKTSDPLRLNSFKNLANAAKQSLDASFAGHPLRYLATLLAIIIALLILATEYHSSLRRERLYIASSRHRLHIR